MRYTVTFICVVSRPLSRLDLHQYCSCQSKKKSYYISPSGKYLPRKFYINQTERSIICSRFDKNYTVGYHYINNLAVIPARNRVWQLLYLPFVLAALKPTGKLGYVMQIDFSRGEQTQEHNLAIHSLDSGSWLQLTIDDLLYYTLES